MSCTQILTLFCLLRDISTLLAPKNVQVDTTLAYNDNELLKVAIYIFLFIAFFTKLRKMWRSENFAMYTNFDTFLPAEGDFEIVSA